MSQTAEWRKGFQAEETSPVKGGQMGASHTEKTEDKRRGDRGRDGGGHRCLHGHEFEQAPGDGERQGSLACCSPWAGKEPDTIEPPSNNNSDYRCKRITDYRYNLRPERERDPATSPDTRAGKVNCTLKLMHGDFSQFPNRSMIVFPQLWNGDSWGTCITGLF